MSKKIFGLRAGYPAIILGLVVIPLLSACSAVMPAGPNLVGIGDFQDESLGEDGEILFQKKKFERLDLPAPDVTGSLMCSVTGQPIRPAKYRVTVHKNMDSLLK